MQYLIGKKIYINNQYYGTIIDITDNLIFIQKNSNQIPDAILKTTFQKIKKQIKIIDESRGDEIDLLSV